MTLKKRDKYILWGVFALYVILHIFLITRHEAWRDESQAWTIARNATLPQLFGVLCTEGHPALWFLFLRIFAKLGFPFAYISYISLALMVISLYLLLFKSPFSLPVKLCLSFSTLFCYYNPVIARIYSLIVLIVTLLAVLWDKRGERPVLYGFLVFLLFQTHILMAGLAGGILLCMGIDFLKKDGRKQKNLIGILVGFSGAILTFLELYQRKGVPTTLDVSGGTMGSFLQIAYMRYGYFRYISEFLKQLYPYLNKISAKWLILPTLLVFAGLIFMAIKNKSFYAPITMACGAGFVIFVILVIYPGNYQALLCALYAIFFACWIGSTDLTKLFDRRFLAVLMSVICVMTFSQIGLMLNRDIRRPYSGAKETARYIEENLPENSTVLVCYDSLVSAVISFSYDSRPDITFYDVDKDEEYSFYVWGENREINTAEEIKAAAGKLGGNVYLLTGSFESAGFERIFFTQGSVIAEEYNLYTVK